MSQAITGTVSPGQPFSGRDHSLMADIAPTNASRAPRAMREAPKCLLLALPPELRNRIYEFVFILSSEISFRWPYTDKNARPYCNIDIPKALALTRTCYQINRESRAVFFGCNTFAFPFTSRDPGRRGNTVYRAVSKYMNAVTGFLDRMSKWDRKAVSRIVVELDEMDVETVMSDPNFVGQWSRALRSLRDLARRDAKCVVQTRIAFDLGGCDFWPEELRLEDLVLDTRDIETSIRRRIEEVEDELRGLIEVRVEEMQSAKLFVQRCKEIASAVARERYQYEVKG